jgi:hypothetical protein
MLLGANEVEEGKGWTRVGQRGLEVCACSDPVSTL